METPRSNQEIEELFRHKVGLAEMLKGGVIMDVTNAEQAKIAEEAGAVQNRREGVANGRRGGLVLGIVVRIHGDHIHLRGNVSQQPDQSPGVLGRIVDAFE